MCRVRHSLFARGVKFRSKLTSGVLERQQKGPGYLDRNESVGETNARGLALCTASSAISNLKKRTMMCLSRVAYMRLLWTGVRENLSGLLVEKDRSQRANRNTSWL
jgi:hypothetical protein